MRWRRALAAVTAAVIAAVGLVVSPSDAPARALSGSQWVAGNIISDGLFYDSGAMTQAQIQTFLNGKIGSCTNGRCLNVLTDTVASHPAAVSASTGKTICNAFAGGTLSAAAIIYRAQTACGISAKVILVTLQKEQGLVTSRGPSEGALRAAMGMACPDTAPCAAYAKGFGNQVYLGTKQLMTYKADQFGRQPGPSYIGYSPAASCRGTTVNIRNYATAALYNYTPYQPNAAALANLSGTGDSCSSYGNRNFWVYYSTWFGSTQGASSVSTDLGPTVDAIDASGALWMYRISRSSGSWVPQVKLATGLVGGTVIGAGDFNGDGHRDILVIDSSGAMVDYPTDGEVSVGQPIRVSTGWGSMTAVLSPGDFSGDGVPDILARDASGALWLYRGTGLGGLRPRVQVGQGWDAMTALVGVGDFNGDRTNDLLARDQTGALWLYPGNGHGGWLARRQVGQGWNVMTALVAPSDANHDGHVDLLARDAAGALWLYPGTGTGGWKGRSQVGTGWNAMASLSGPGSPASGRPYVEPPGAGDLNSDGSRDVLAQDADGNLWLYPGNGAAGWLPRQKLAQGWGSMTATFGVGDFDHNGLDDFMARDAGGDLYMYTPNANGTLSKAQVGHDWQGFTKIFGAGDITGDHNPDVLAIDANGDLHLYPGNGTGWWGPSVVVGTGWDTMTRVIDAGDVNGDGRNDLLATDASGVLWFYGGVGAGTWTSRVRVGQGWATMKTIVSPGDITGDGLPDLLAETATGALMLYAGTGGTSWALPRQIGQGWQSMAWIY
jgi:hypothetical protein